MHWCELAFIAQVRVRDFQLVSLRLIVARMLCRTGTGASLTSRGSRDVQASELYVPGELQLMNFHRCVAWS